MLKYAKTEFVFYNYKFGHSCATASPTIILCVLIAGASAAIFSIFWSAGSVSSLYVNVCRTFPLDIFPPGHFAPWVGHSLKE